MRRLSCRVWGSLASWTSSGFMLSLNTCDGSMGAGHDLGRRQRRPGFRGGSKLFEMGDREHSCELSVSQATQPNEVHGSLWSRQLGDQVLCIVFSSSLNGMEALGLLEIRAPCRMSVTVLRAQSQEG